uniref:Uncharacterized protein n=1 Tax=Timspurckia oligopyrenoides TaxID=708627 RepID=A0A7S1ERW4_9RHOD|mmetsp:Transcript_3181/g.5605  ORF Transcript_3181/g.5605 Transcript_3181/m.5605 type:complete len:135 (+) Transcript_3181:362-766(+)
MRRIVLKTSSGIFAVVCSMFKMRDANTTCNACRMHEQFTARKPRISNWISVNDARATPDTIGINDMIMYTENLLLSSMNEKNVTKNGVRAFDVCMKEIGMNLSAIFPSMIFPPYKRENIVRSNVYVRIENGVDW